MHWGPDKGLFREVKLEEQLQKEMKSSAFLSYPLQVKGETGTEGHGGENIALYEACVFKPTLVCSEPLYCWLPFTYLTCTEILVNDLLVNLVNDGFRL